MNRGLATLVLALSLAGCVAVRPLGTAGREAQSRDRQILLTVAERGSPSTALTGAPGERYVRLRGYGPSPAVERTLLGLAKENGLEPVDGWPIASLKVYCEVFYVPKHLPLGGVIEKLAGDPRVDLVQPMNTFRTLTEHYDDPYADLQSSVKDLDIEDAHRLATGKDVLVAVIDSAVDAGHPELRGHVSIDRDLVDGRLHPKRGEIHGTAVAGIIGSASDNHIGIVGVAPDARIAALRACWAVVDGGASAECSTFSLAKALETALSLKPAVINLSLTGPFDPLLARLVRQAVRDGIVVVAAEPKTRDAAHSFPSSVAGVIVGSSEVADESSLPADCLPAPGREVLTTTPGAGYGFLSGSSLAAAHVSGVIALLKQRDPGLTRASIWQLLRNTAVWTGHAMSINACLALERLAAAGSASPPAPRCGRSAER